MKIKDGNLLFFGDTYVSATWIDENSNDSYIAIFRDLSDDGISNFTITQLAGPWIKRNDETKDIEFVEYYKDLWWELRSRAEVICDNLNREKPVNWTGDIQRH